MRGFRWRKHVAEVDTSTFTAQKSFWTFVDVNLARFTILVVLLKTQHPRTFSLTVIELLKAYIRIRLLTKEGKTFLFTLYSDQTNGGELGRCTTPCFSAAPSHQASQTIAGTRRGPLVAQCRRRRLCTLPLAAEGWIINGSVTCWRFSACPSTIAATSICWQSLTCCPNIREFNHLEPTRGT